MDIEATVARYLKSVTKYPAYLDKPTTEQLGSTTEYIVVQLTGGGSNVLDAQSIDVDCYAPKGQRKKAAAIAAKVADAALDLDTIDNLFSPTVENIYRSNDLKTEEARYIVQLSVYRNN